MKDSGRRWLIAAVGLFLFLLVGWVLLALQLNSALAGPLPFGPGLMSRLSADYRADEGGRSVALISLSILNDAMVALGLTEDEAAAAHESMELAMSQPVPTATAMDFEGAAPFTATPTITNTPLPTITPSRTPPNTRRPPTHTPAPTKTDNPTKTPGAPTATLGAPTATSAGGADTEEPLISGSFAVWSPPPGDLSTCTIMVDNVRVMDAVGSSGISPDQVGIKYNPGGGYIFRLGMTLVSGGAQPDTSWDGYYTGSFTLTGITVAGVPGTYKVASPLATNLDIEVYLVVYDDAGNFAFDSDGVEYRVQQDC